MVVKKRRKSNGEDMSATRDYEINEHVTLAAVIVMHRL